MRICDRGLTKDPDTVLQAVLDSFQAQHGHALKAPGPHARSTMCEHVPKVLNWEQRRAIEHDTFAASENCNAP